MISASAALTGSYDYSEVAKSVLIAIVASYAALDLAARVTAAKSTSTAAMATAELPTSGMLTAWERSGGEAGTKLAPAIPV